MKRNTFPSRPVLDRFWEKVEMVTESGCWVWTARCDKNGYARFWAENKAHDFGHRFAYRHFKGPIPEGLEIDHLCRVPSCVNPAHLEAVTGRENNLRGTGPAAKNAKRTHCTNGHKLVEANLYRQGTWRQCRTCARLRHFKTYEPHRVGNKMNRDIKVFLERML